MYKFAVAFCVMVLLGFANQASAQRRLLDGGVIIPRVGVGSAGWGETSIRTNCDGSSTGCLLLGGQGDDSTDFDVEGDGATAVLSLDALMKMGDSFMLGGQFVVQPGLEFEDERTRVDTEIGTGFGLLGVAEFRIKVRRNWTVPLRGQGGLLLVKQAEGLEGIVERAEDRCELYDSQSGQDCRQVGPLGFQLGASAGVVYNLNKVGLRVDVGYVFDWLRMYRQRFDSDSADAVRRQVGLWNRFHVMFGLEL